jgi:hypothetical protein
MWLAQKEVSRETTQMGFQDKGSHRDSGFEGQTGE